MDIFPGAVHSAGPSMIIPLDLSKNMRKPLPCSLCPLTWQSAAASTPLTWQQVWPALHAYTVHASRNAQSGRRMRVAQVSKPLPATVHACHNRQAHSLTRTHISQLNPYLSMLCGCRRAIPLHIPQPHRQLCAHRGWRAHGDCGQCHHPHVLCHEVQPLLGAAMSCCNLTACWAMCCTSDGSRSALGTILACDTGTQDRQVMRSGAERQL